MLFWNLHRSPVLWGADADQFRPGRWREQRSNSELPEWRGYTPNPKSLYPNERDSDFAFCPFGAGVVLRSCLWSCGALTKAGTQDEMAKALGFDNSRNPRLLSKFWAFFVRNPRLLSKFWVLTKAGAQDGKSRKEQEPSNIQPCWLFCGFVGNSNNQANVQAGNRNNTATTPTWLRFPAWLLVLGPGT